MSELSTVELRTGIDALLAELDSKIRDPGSYSGQVATDFARRWREGRARMGSDQAETTDLRMTEDAVEAGIEAAAKWVSEGDESFLVGRRGWNSKEFRIAERAAREAIAALRQFEAGK